MGPGKSQYIYLFSHLVFVGSGGPVRATPPAFQRVGWSDFATPLLNCVSESHYSVSRPKSRSYSRYSSVGRRVQY